MTNETAVAEPETDNVDERLKRYRPPQAIPPTPPSEPTEDERKRSQVALQAKAARPVPPEVRMGRSQWGQPEIGLPTTDIEGWMAQAQAAFGSCSPAFVRVELGRLAKALDVIQDGMDLEDRMNAALATITALRPRDEAEAMAASQMVVSHAVTMGMMIRVQCASHNMMPEHLQVYGATAAKFMRAYTGQMEALSRMRRPAHQTIRVEKVEVRDNGQAIVGAISSLQEGGPQ